MKLTPEQLDRLERMAREQAARGSMVAVTPGELIALLDGYYKTEETKNDVVPTR